MGRTKLLIFIQNTIANEWKTVQILQRYSDIKLSIKCRYYNGQFVGHFTLKYCKKYASQLRHGHWVRLYFRMLCENCQIDFCKI